MHSTELTNYNTYKTTVQIPHKCSITYTSLSAINVFFLFWTVPGPDTDFFFNDITKAFLINFYHDSPTRSVVVDNMFPF